MSTVEPAGVGRTGASRAGATGGDLAAILAEIVDATGGPVTGAELSRACDRLAAADRR